MSVRLGHVIYWVACGLAVLWVILAFVASSTRSVPEWWFDGTIGIVGGCVIWLIGRACRYILSGN